MFNGVTRLLFWLIAFDFQVKHKPGAKIGLADFLLQNPNNEVTPVKTYDYMFTLMKINSKRSVIAFNTSNSSKKPKTEIKPSSQSFCSMQVFVE